VSIWSIAQSRHPEMMDDPALPADEHMHALDALARINAVSLTAFHMARAIEPLTADRPSGPGQPPLRVVDVACGGGDVTVAVARRLGRRLSGGPPGTPAVQMTGFDISPRAVERARQRVRDGDAAERASTGAAAHVAFEVRDILLAGCPPCDVATCSLFLHHLDDDDAIRLLVSLSDAARIGVVISDLLRSPAGLTLAVVGTAVLSGSRVARVDGPASVRAARTTAEYRTLLDRAGLHAATIRRIWPERALLAWARPADGRPREPVIAP